MSTSFRALLPAAALPCLHVCNLRLSSRRLAGRPGASLAGLRRATPLPPSHQPAWRPTRGTPAAVPASRRPHRRVVQCVGSPPCLCSHCCSCCLFGAHCAGGALPGPLGPTPSPNPLLASHLPASHSCTIAADPVFALANAAAPCCPPSPFPPVATCTCRPAAACATPCPSPTP